MRMFIAALSIGLTSMALGAGAPPAHRNAPVGSDEGLFPYRSELGSLGYEDILRLNDGSQRIGKAMEWADQVLLYDGHGRPSVFDLSDIKEFELRRTRRHLAAPQLPDLTVAYVEGLPRDPSWQGHVVVEQGVPKADISAAQIEWHPKPGTSTTLKVHVLNAGPAKSSEVDCRVLVDGRPISTSKLPALDSRAEHVLECAWAWQDGPHMLRVEIDPDGVQQESVRWNNTFDEPMQALAVAVIVARERYEAFKNMRNLVDSFCFEDWLQYQLRCLNGLFKASVYSSAPQGIRERVRCDRIIVVDDPTDSAQRARWEATLRQGQRPEGLCEQAGTLVYGAPAPAEMPAYSALKVDWNKLKQLGLELGLVDLRATDTRVQQCLVQDRGERIALRQHLFPWPATLMHTPGGFRLSELCAAYLNQAMGKPRGFRGEYLYQVPETITIDIRTNTGAPAEGVQVDAFAIQSEGQFAGYIAGAGRDPLYSAVTNAEGRLDLPNLDAPAASTPNGYRLRPNAFGKIAMDGSNGLLLLRLRNTNEGVLREEFHFLRLFDCAVAYVQGDAARHVHVVQTRFPDAGVPLAPIEPLIVMDDRSATLPPMQLRWRRTTSLLDLEEYRIYKRIGLGGDDETPWLPVSTIRKSGKTWLLQAGATYFDPPRGRPPYSADTSFAVTTVNKRGQESGLSTPTFMPFDKQCLKFAIDTDAAYITLVGAGPVQMLRYDGEVGVHPFAVNTTAFDKYRPSFAGIAVTPDHRLVVTDPANHVLALYDLNGNLEELLPRRGWWPGFPSDKTGEFYDPADVATNKDGRLFVADRGNDRVQILDSRGGYIGIVEPGFHFIRPQSVAVSNGHLCVTDNSGTRLRVYRLEGDEVKFERQLPPQVNLDRGIVSSSGRIYATGQDPKSKGNGILIFVPEGDSARLDSSVFDTDLGKLFDPRGAYLYGSPDDPYLYVVNAFPFDVRRHKLDGTPSTPDKLTNPVPR